MKLTHELATALAQIDDPELVAGFLEEILTPKEVKDISLRWQLLRELQEGKTQRDIAQRHQMSLCKITRGAKLLKNRNSVTNRVLQGYPKEVKK